MSRGQGRPVCLRSGFLFHPCQDENEADDPTACQPCQRSLSPRGETPGAISAGFSRRFVRGWREGEGTEDSHSCCPFHATGPRGRARGQGREPQVANRMPAESQSQLSSVQTSPCLEDRTVPEHPCLSEFSRISAVTFH